MGLVALALITAFGLGIGSTVMMLDASSGFGAIRIGPWKAFPEAQMPDADPYAKSHRARAGRLLLGVPMSSPQTGRLVLERTAGMTVRHLPPLRDVDTWADAVAVAAAAPDGGFATAVGRIGATVGATG